MSNTGALIVATPAVDDPIHSYGTEPDPHVTMLWFGDAEMLPPDVVQGVRTAVTEVVGEFDPFQVKVSGRGLLGPDDASVLLLESPELVEIRQVLSVYEAIETAWDMAESQFPYWVCHLTTSYDGQVPVDPPQEIRFDSLGLWLGEEKTSYPLENVGFLEDDPLSASAIVPPVLCLDDLAPALRYADHHPSARWYMQRRATALGVPELIPAGWAVPV